MNFPLLMQPKRILMTADTVGGVWTYAVELIRALAEEEIQVGLATMGELLTKEQRNQIRELPNVELFESRYKLEWMQDPWTDVARAGDWLLQLEERFHPDVIHLNGYSHAALPWRTPKVVVAHSCVLSWWQAVKESEIPAEWSTYAAMVARGLKAADLVVAPSEFMLSELKMHYGPIAAGEVIPNGREPSLFRPGVKEDFILAAGRLWDEAKNISLLAAAAPKLSWPVYLAGEAQHPEGGMVRPRAVRLLGRLAPEELVGWYARASIYAMPARYEPFGLSILEAALSGCALVLGDVPSLREIWDEAALFVSPRDPEELVFVLQHLASDPERCKALGELARNRAGLVTTERMIAGYLSVYSDAMMLRVPAAVDPKEVLS